MIVLESLRFFSRNSLPTLKLHRLLVRVRNRNLVVERKPNLLGNLWCKMNDDEIWLEYHVESSVAYVLKLMGKSHKEVVDILSFPLINHTFKSAM